MKKLLATLVVAFAIAFAGQAMAQDGKKLVAIVGTPEPQIQLMSMVLSMQALQQGASVYILLCGPGGDLALKDAPDSATAPQEPGMSPQGLMQKIMAEGGTVEVCAIYLPNKGLGADALIDGVGTAKPPEMAGRLLEDDARIMSF
ncbi:MAG: hypothetical protein ACOC23_09615 [Thermodesulfobacteriota bacterium]